MTPCDGMQDRGAGLAAEKRQAAAGDMHRSCGHRCPRGIEGTRSSRISCVRNTETVRHEALHDRAEVKGLRRRAVAAARLELRAA